MNAADLITVLLTVMFVGFKITGQIDWSWWLVLSPVFVYFGVVFLIIGGALFYIWWTGYNLLTGSSMPRRRK